MDASCSSVVGHGNSLATSDLLLSFVLYAPNFTLNLLSINQLTKNLNCSVIFFPSYFLF